MKLKELILLSLKIVSLIILAPLFLAAFFQTRKTKKTRVEIN